MTLDDLDSFSKERAFMKKWNCSFETARSYFELRSEGCTPEAALVWCGLAA